MSKHWQNSAKKQFSIPKFKGKFWDISLIWKFFLLAVLKSKIMWALVFFFWDAYYLVPASLCFRVVISSKLQRKKNQTKKHTINRVFACMHWRSFGLLGLNYLFFLHSCSHFAEEKHIWNLPNSVQFQILLLARSGFCKCTVKRYGRVQEDINWYSLAESGYIFI